MQWQSSTHRRLVTLSIEGQSRSECYEPGPKPSKKSGDTMPTLVDLITQFRMETHDVFPYLSPYVFCLDPKETPGLGTMAVDKYGRLYYDPAWCETLTLKNGAYVVLHEAWHIILRHCHRAEQILGSNPTAQDRYDLNVAFDIIVWEMLEAIADWAPPGGVTLPDSQKRWPEIKRNMTASELFAIINRKIEQPPQPGRNPDENEEVEPDEDTPDMEPADEDGDLEGSDDTDVGNPGGKVNKPGKPGDSTDESEDGDGGGKPKATGQDQGGNGEGRGKADSPGPQGKGDGDGEVNDHGFNPIGGGSAADGIERDYEVEPDPNWEAFKEDQLLSAMEAKIEELENDVEWRRSRGTIPGCLKDTIRRKLRPQPNPWDSLRATVAKCAANHRGAPDYTYQRPNRRQAAIPDAPRLKGLKKYSPKAVVCIDTSGSMTTRCKVKVVQVCRQGLQAIGKFPVVCGDAQVQSDSMLTNIKDEFEFPGGGGTDMKVLIEYAEKKYKPDVIVIGTDGETDWPEKTKAQLIIALTQDSKTPDWATTVRIPDDPSKEEL